MHQAAFRAKHQAMVRAPARKLLALWLGFFFALSVVLSAAQMGAMSCDMAMSDGMAKSGHMKDPDCAQSMPKKNAVQACVAKCVAPASFVLPEATIKPISPSSTSFATAESPPLIGRVSSPDPPPPRPAA